MNLKNFLPINYCKWPIIVIFVVIFLKRFDWFFSDLTISNLRQWLNPSNLEEQLFLRTNHRFWDVETVVNWWIDCLNSSFFLIIGNNCNKLHVLAWKNIGNTLLSWKNICNKLLAGKNISIFYYNPLYSLSHLWRLQTRRYTDNRLTKTAYWPMKTYVRREIGPTHEFNWKKTQRFMFILDFKTFLQG